MARLFWPGPLERLHGPEQLDAFRVLEEEFDNLVSAARLGALRGNPEVAAGAALAASEVFERRGPFDVGIELLSEALSLGLDDGSAGMLERRLGVLARMAGRTDQARIAFESALTRSQTLGNRRFEGIVLGNLGNFHYEQGRMDEALEHYEDAIEIHREVGDRPFEGIALMNLGTLYFHQGRVAEARKHYDDALEIHREVGNLRFEGGVLGSLGSLHFHQGRMDESRACFDAGEALLRKTADPLELGKLLCKRARFTSAEGDRDSSLRMLHEAESLAEEAGAGPGSELGRLLAETQRELGDSQSA